MTWQNVDSIELPLNCLKEATFRVGNASFVFGRGGGVKRGEKELKSSSHELTVVTYCQYCTCGLLITLYCSVLFCCPLK